MFGSLWAIIVSAGPSQTPPDGNISAPITQLPSAQVKTGGLAIDNFLVGDLINPIGFGVFTATGKLGLNMGITGSGIDNPTEALDVNGLIRLSYLDVSGAPICADENGELEKCSNAVNNNFVIYQHDGDNSQPYETETFTVPAGVTSITVELWGAGGAGRVEYITQSDSPDNSNYCAVGSTYGCQGGGSAILLESNGTTQILRARGGGTPTSPHSGGIGGSVQSGDISNNSKIVGNSVETINGENGGNGQMVGTPFSTFNFSCNSVNYSVKIGNNGGEGGYGGRSGNSSRAPGGLGGRGGFGPDSLIPEYRCDPVWPFGDGFGFVSPGGIDGFFGTGGSGPGGFGGQSDPDYSSVDCDQNPIYNPTFIGCVPPKQGYAGGGGGAYVKAVLNVTEGETYKIKLSHKGTANLFSEDLLILCWTGRNNCSFWGPVKFSSWSGTLSGDGSPATARITY